MEHFLLQVSHSTSTTWTSTTAKNSACPAGLILLLHSMENNLRELRGSVCCDHYSQDRLASLEGLHHTEYSIPYQERGCEITSTSYMTFIEKTAAPLTKQRFCLQWLEGTTLFLYPCIIFVSLNFSLVKDWHTLSVDQGSMIAEILGLILINSTSTVL